jgi:hypothetical protein
MIEDRDWLPVWVEPNCGRPAIGWLQCTGADFTEPFFHQTVARLIANGSPTKTSSFDELISIETETFTYSPSCFILHISRCGSTAIANAVRAAGLVVYSEPQPLVALLCMLRSSRQSRENQTDLIDRATKRAMSVFVNLAKGKPVFIKMPSWACMFARNIGNLYPAVPILFMYRNPVEIIVSIMERPTGWMSFRDNPRRLRSLIGDGIDRIINICPLEFCALMLDTFCKSVVEAPLQQLLCLEYSSLDCDAVQRLMALIGQMCNSAQVRAIQQSLLTYSGDPRREQLYVDDSQGKVVRASDEMALLADSLLNGSVRALSRLKRL